MAGWPEGEDGLFSAMLGIVSRFVPWTTRRHPLLRGESLNQYSIGLRALRLREARVLYSGLLLIEAFMTLSPLTALTALDGRYRAKIEPLAQCFS